MHTSPKLFLIGCQAFGIGLIVGICASWMVYTVQLIPIMMYLCLLGVFHLLEFLSLSLVNPLKTDHQSFLLDHGKFYYFIIIGLGTIEYFGRMTLNQKGITPIITIGIILSIGGQVLRTASMIECSTSFTHEIEFRKGMKIIKTGPYSVVRHPSYLAYLVMVVGNQMVLGNWISLIIIIPSLIFFFFRERIAYEEGLLEGKEEYRQYKKEVKWSGVPFC